MCDREGEARVKLSQYNTTQYFIQEIKTEVTKGTVYTDTPGLSCKGRNVSLGLKNASIGGYTLRANKYMQRKGAIRNIVSELHFNVQRISVLWNIILFMS